MKMKVRDLKRKATPLASPVKYSLSTFVDTFRHACQKDNGGWRRGRGSRDEAVSDGEPATASPRRRETARERAETKGEGRHSVMLRWIGNEAAVAREEGLEARR